MIGSISQRGIQEEPLQNKGLAKFKNGNWECGPVFRVLAYVHEALASILSMRERKREQGG
jgi:hypothetical protein